MIHEQGPNPQIEAPIAAATTTIVVGASIAATTTIAAGASIPSPQGEKE